MTPAQLAYAQTMLGGYACNFNSGQLYAYYTAAEDGGASNPVNGVVALAFYSLMVGAVEMTNFRQGETQENEAIIFDRLKGLYDLWYNQAGFPAPLPTFTMQEIELGYIIFPEDMDDLYVPL